MTNVLENVMERYDAIVYMVKAGVVSVEELERVPWPERLVSLIADMAKAEVKFKEAIHGHD